MADSELKDILPPTKTPEQAPFSSERPEQMPPTEQPQPVERPTEGEPILPLETVLPSRDEPVGAEVPPQPEAPVVAASEIPPKDADQIRVERLLENDLRELYFALPKDQRDRFRERGEATALRIRAMLDDGKTRPAQVEREIHDWLKTIPDVNHLFLLQETKIKTDEITKLMRERRGEV